MPVYWRPRYGTRSSRHRAWARQEAKREQRLERSGSSMTGWFRQLFRRYRPRP
jgi:hypothetical protein